MLLITATRDQLTFPKVSLLTTQIKSVTVDGGSTQHIKRLLSPRMSFSKPRELCKASLDGHIKKKKFQVYQKDLYWITQVSNVKTI